MMYKGGLTRRKANRMLKVSAKSLTKCRQRCKFLEETLTKDHAVQAAKIKELETRKEELEQILRWTGYLTFANVYFPKTDEGNRKVRKMVDLVIEEMINGDRGTTRDHQQGMG